MNRYVCAYNIDFSNPHSFDGRSLIMIVRAQNENDALTLVMGKIKDSDKRDWRINQIIEVEHEPIEALVVIRGR